MIKHTCIWGDGTFLVRLGTDKCSGNCDNISKYQVFITSSWVGFQPQAVHVSGDTPADSKNRKSVLVSDLNPGTEYCVRMSFTNDRTFVSPKSDQKCTVTPNRNPTQLLVIKTWYLDILSQFHVDFGAS
jgi:hypothetical protein